MTVVQCGKKMIKALVEGDLDMVKDMWAVELKSYDSLRDRFRSEAKAQNKGRHKRQRVNTSRLQIPSNWRPRQGLCFNM